MSEIFSHIGNTHSFPILLRTAFFNHAGVAPIPQVGAEALRKFADEAAAGAYLGASWYQDIEHLRATAAQLINARPGEMAFVKNTSEGISIVASGIDWQWGDRIVTTAVEYPANIYPWMEQVRTRGCKLVMVPEEADEAGRRRVPLDQRHDLEAIGRFCRANKKLFCVDAIQSLGVIPLDVQAMQIDYLAADGHKWMLGPEGAGIFYCRRELIERTRPLMIGWMNVIDAINYGSYDYTLRSDAGRFECGSHNLAGLLALRASLGLLMDSDIAAVGQRVKIFTDRLILGLMVKGYQVVSPRSGLEWSGIVSFVSPKLNHQQIFVDLRKQHIEIALREGRLRASPHFYNTEAQIDKLLDALPTH
jgi:cysteine desulfurase / selenocysteine lyase